MTKIRKNPDQVGKFVLRAEELQGTLQNSNGNLTTDSATMATIFNNFFVNVADGVTKRIPRSPKSPLDYPDGENPNSFL